MAYFYTLNSSKSFLNTNKVASLPTEEGKNKGSDVMDVPGVTSTGSIRFATIYPASLVGLFTRAMMLSEPCFLITTQVYDYPGQLQAVTGTVAVFASVPANSVKYTFCKLLF